MKKLFYIVLFLFSASAASAWGVLDRAGERADSNNRDDRFFLIEKIIKREPIKIMFVYADSTKYQDRLDFDKEYGETLEKLTRKSVADWKNAIINTLQKLPPAEKEKFADIIADWNRDNLVTFIPYGSGVADLKIAVTTMNDRPCGDDLAIACVADAVYGQAMMIYYHPRSPMPFDIAVRHEFGHNLGLSDQCYPKHRKNYSNKYYAPCLSESSSVMTPAYTYANQNRTTVLNYPISADDVEGIIILTDLFKSADKKPQRFIKGWKSFVRKDTYYRRSLVSKPPLPTSKEIMENQYRRRLLQNMRIETLKRDLKGLKSKDIKKLSNKNAS